MSILSVILLSHGITFAADRNVTITDETTGVELQELGTKVFCSPTNDALVGFVGAADTASGVALEVWLPNFLARNSPCSNPGSIAKKLRTELERDMHVGEACIVQYAAFADRGGIKLPEYYHITNVPGMNTTTGAYSAPLATYGCSEEFIGHVLTRGTAPANVRAWLRRQGAAYDPPWFRQSIKLGLYNWLNQGAKAAVQQAQTHGLVTFPSNLAEWEQHAAFWILLFGAYYEAFSPVGQRYVGGGVDVVSIAWP